MRYFSSFTGAGGFDLAVPSGWECVGFSEIDKYASMVLKYRFPDVKNYGDINAIKWNEIPNFEVLCGGTPCQDLSLAGKRKGLTGERSGLFYKFVEALKAKKPKYFVWENVKGALSSNSGWDFAEVLNQFSEAGYSLWWQVLNAKYFSVPQNRERIFIVGFRDGSPPEVFFEPSSLAENNELQGQPTANTLRARYSQNEGSYIIEGKQQAQEAKLTYRHTFEKFKGYEGISPTIKSSEGSGNQIIVNNIRRLMPKECERLMSWPDDWTRWGIDEKGKKVEISDTQRYKMAGNGVVSNVVEWLIENVILEDNNA